MNEYPPGGGAPMGAGLGAPPTPAGEYEFNATQEQTISALSGSMLFAGTAWIVFGVLVAAFGALMLLTAGPFAIPVFVGAAVLFMQGIYTRSSGEAFKRVATTQGNDIANLMSAFGDLYKLYSMLRTVIIVAFVLVALLFALLLPRSRTMSPAPSPATVGAHETPATSTPLAAR